jgi:surfactin synthase thioesterase subunit
MTWLRDWAGAGDVEVRLLCLPPAGGSAHLYRRWTRLLPSSIGVLAVELPGRGSRLAEPPVTSLEQMVEPLCRELGPLLDRPLVVFGHSMGATLGVALCRAVQVAEPGWSPALFVAAAAEPPDSVLTKDFSFRDDDAALVGYLQKMGGTPPELLGNPEYLEMLLPPLRADLSVLAGLRPSVAPPLGCPVRVYLGDADPSVRADRIPGWERESSGPAPVTRFEGGHFFVLDPVERVLAALRRDIATAVRPITRTAV